MRIKRESDCPDTQENALLAAELSGRRLVGQAISSRRLAGAQKLLNRCKTPHGCRGLVSGEAGKVDNTEYGSDSNLNRRLSKLTMLS